MQSIFQSIGAGLAGLAVGITSIFGGGAKTTSTPPAQPLPTQTQSQTTAVCSNSFTISGCTQSFTIASTQGGVGGPTLTPTPGGSGSPGGPGGPGPGGPGNTTNPLAPTSTPKPTPTVTNIPTPTNTPTPSFTPTPTKTPTPTRTPTPTKIAATPASPSATIQPTITQAQSASPSAGAVIPKLPESGGVAPTIFLILSGIAVVMVGFVLVRRI